MELIFRQKSFSEVVLRISSKLCKLVSFSLFMLLDRGIYVDVIIMLITYTNYYVKYKQIFAFNPIIIITSFDQ